MNKSTVSWEKSKCFAGTSEGSKRAPSGKKEPRKERSERLPHQSVMIAVPV